MPYIPRADSFDCSKSTVSITRLAAGCTFLHEVHLSVFITPINPQYHPFHKVRHNTWRNYINFPTQKLRLPSSFSNIFFCLVKCRYYFKKKCIHTCILPQQYRSKHVPIRNIACTKILLCVCVCGWVWGYLSVSANMPPTESGKDTYEFVAALIYLVALVRDSLPLVYTVRHLWRKVLSFIISLISMNGACGGK